MKYFLISLILINTPALAFNECYWKCNRIACADNPELAEQCLAKCPANKVVKCKAAYKENFAARYNEKFMDDIILAEAGKA